MFETTYFQPQQFLYYYYYYLFILHRAESYGNGCLLSKDAQSLPHFYLLGLSHIFGLLALSRP
jgi:hypothetical protein